MKALGIRFATSVGLLMGAFSPQLVSFAVFTPATVAYAQLIAAVIGLAIACVSIARIKVHRCPLPSSP